MAVINSGPINVKRMHSLSHDGIEHPSTPIDDNMMLVGEDGSVTISILPSTETHNIFSWVKMPPNSRNFTGFEYNQLMDVLQQILGELRLLNKG